MQVRMLKSGEQGLVVEFGDEIDAVINAQVHRLAKCLAVEIPERIVEMVPTYRSLMIYYDPLVIGRESLQEEIAKHLANVEDVPAASEVVRVIEIPVCYGGEFGPDLEFVAKHNAIGADEVVAIHTSVPYLVYMIGFTPGFPYLGGMSERIAAPRLDVPRVRIPAGSVGIAGKQTGVYPIESPGGWRLIGRTPLNLFEPSSNNPFLFAAGDSLHFFSIDDAEYGSIAEQVARERYAPVVRTTTRAEARSCAR